MTQTRGALLGLLAAAACLVVAPLTAMELRPNAFAHAPADFPHLWLVQAMAQWDAGWYEEIAQNGYWYKPGQQSPVAFFPAFPLAIRAVSSLGINRWEAGSVLSLLCGCAAMLLFVRWAKLRAPGSTPVYAGLLFALYPFAFYLYGVVYSDGLFLLLAVGAFFCLERDRPWGAAVLGALATAARPVAPALVVGLLVRSWERRRERNEPLRWTDALPALSGLGLAAYMAFLQLRFGDALAFAHVQAAPGWDHVPGWHTWLKLTWFEVMFPRVAPLVAIRLGGHALVTLAALAMVVPTWRKLGKGYGAYCAIAVGLPALSSKDLQGLGRYVMAAFPLFLTGALMLEKTPRLRTGWLWASALGLLLLAAAFGAGGFVA